MEYIWRPAKKARMGIFNVKQKTIMEIKSYHTEVKKQMDDLLNKLSYILYNKKFEGFIDENWEFQNIDYEEIRVYLPKIFSFDYLNKSTPHQDLYRYVRIMATQALEQKRIKVIIVM